MIRIAAFKNQYTVEAELGVLFFGSFKASKITDERLENHVLRNYVLKEGFDPADKNDYL